MFTIESLFKVEVGGGLDHSEEGSTSSLAKARGAIGNKEVNLGSRI